MSRSAIRVHALILSVAFAAACSSGKDDQQGAIDSLLMRDLTLAASASPVAAGATFGDTAISRSGSGNRATEAIAPAAVAVPKPAIKEPVSSPQRASAARLPTPQPEQTSEVARKDTVHVVETPAVTPAAPKPDAATGSGGATSTTGRRTIGSGAVLAGRTTQEICSVANRPGDRFVVNLANDVVGDDGSVLRAGTPVLIELASTPAEGPFGFRVKSVQVNEELLPVQGSVRADGSMTDKRVPEGSDKGKVIGGAVAGAILGKVLGGGAKGTVVGAAAGGAAGTIAASRSGKVERCLPAGSSITVTLSSPLVLASGTQ